MWCLRMLGNVKHLTVLFLGLYVQTCHCLCNVVVSSDVANRTMCTLPKIEEGEPLHIEIDNPAYLYLTISDGGIPRDAFKNVKPIKELWVIGTNITFIQPGAFDNLTTLNSLAVSNTSITKLSKDTFVGLINLGTLALSNNLISIIEDGAFLGLENLQQLILDDNKITRLNEKTFEGLKFLRGLFLNNNPIQYIHDSALRNVKELTHLNISIVQGKNVSENALQLPRVFQLRVFYILD